MLLGDPFLQVRGLGVSHSLWCYSESVCLRSLDLRTWCLPTCPQRFSLFSIPTSGWAALSPPPPSRSAQRTVPAKMNGSQCLGGRFPPPSLRQTGSRVRAGGGLAAEFFVFEVPRQGSGGAALNTQRLTEGSWRECTSKGTSGQLQRWGVGGPHPRSEVPVSHTQHAGFPRATSFAAGPGPRLPTPPSSRRPPFLSKGEPRVH